MLRIAESETDDGRGKEECQDKDNEMSPFHCGDKLLPVTDLGHCDYPPYPALHQFAPCPHCGHPPTAAVHPSAPPVEDDGSCSDQQFFVHPETTGPMPPRTYSDAATFMCSDRDPAYFARSNSVPAAMPPHLVRSYTCPSCPSAAIAPPSYDDSHRDRIVS